MRQFDVCRNPSPRSRVYAPYVLVLQSHLLEEMPTTLVAPVILAAGRRGYTKISVQVELDGVEMIVLVAEMAVIDPAALRAGGSLLQYEDDIRRALDRVFTGF